MKNSKGISPEEREALLWEFAKKCQSGVEISDELLKKLGLVGWMEESNSVARMRFILFCCTAIVCTIWFASGVVAYFAAGDTGMFIASPLIAFPVYKTIEYFVKRSKQTRR